MLGCLDGVNRRIDTPSGTGFDSGRSSHDASSVVFAFSVC